jgi:hypothetical protein
LSSHPAPKGINRRAHATAASDPRGRVRRIALGLLYLAALSLLIVWEYRERLEVLSSECELRDQVKSSLYNRPYERFLDWASSGAAGHVVALAIPLDLEEVQKNLCLGREYMADVLRALASQNPSVVVIDKFYSEGACTSTPASTEHLIQAVGALKMPVVVAESTNGLEHEVASACLVRKPQLDFHAPHVKHGLSRLNSEPERLPLRWLVLSSAPEESGHPSSSKPPEPTAEIPKAEFADSLSLASVKAYDPAFADQAKIRQLALRDDHAYANLAIEVPKLTTTQLLCATGDRSILKKWSVSCPELPALPNLAGRVVVVGAETLTDQKLVLDQRIWGFELQARYIETLLSGDYLGFLAIGWGLGVFALFIFLIEGLPTILVARRPRWRGLPLIRYAYPHRRYLWVIFWTIAVIGISAFLALALRYLPPLLVYGDILLVAVTRLLFFLAESAEDPFLHAHSHRKEHSMPHSHDAQPTHSTSSIQSLEKAPVPPAAPFVPDEPAEPAAAPKSGNKPGSEGASEG